MGVDFGGETIKFQDLSFNVSLPETPIGKVTLFGVNGWNSNEFKGPDDPTEWEEEKDLSDIDYMSSIYAYGITQEAALGSKSSWRNVLVYSSTVADRNQATNADILNSNNTTIFNNDVESVSKLSFSSSVSSRWGDAFTTTAGLKGTSYFWNIEHEDWVDSTDPDWSDIQPRDFSFDVDGLLLQPFVNGNFVLGQRVGLDLGLNSSWFGYTNEFLLESRANLDLKLGAASLLSLRSGLYSQVLSPYAYHTTGEFWNPNTPAPTEVDLTNTGLRFVKSWSSEIGWQQAIGKSLKLSLEGFYQYLYDIPSAYYESNGSPYYFNYMNYDGEDYLGVLYSGGKGRTYGVTAEAKQAIVNGFYIWAGGTLYRSEYQDQNGDYLPSKFDGRYNFNATLGKEFHKKKSEQVEKLFGVNSRIFYQGGFRQQPLYTFWSEYDVKLKDYLRFDLRIQWTKFKEKYTRMFAIDIQNVLNTQNPSYYYFDSVAGKEVLKTQLGMIPVLVYRIDF